jgi:hypothetical protein
MTVGSESSGKTSGSSQEVGLSQPRGYVRDEERRPNELLEEHR